MPISFQKHYEWLWNLTIKINVFSKNITNILHIKCTNVNLNGSKWILNGSNFSVVNCSLGRLIFHPNKRQIGMKFITIFSSTFQQLKVTDKCNLRISKCYFLQRNEVLIDTVN